ncbi:MAG: pyrroline-5-carboxylate reductase [Clostridiales Family XIII bacterium]|jgi:pyrroline-5-carboxylate reductase|nr:pyrroline-5-carboxylate reductase [Clostridiales Family XIII bacterium]
MKIGILGAGNMGGAIAMGYAARGGAVCVYDPDANKVEALAGAFAAQGAKAGGAGAEGKAGGAAGTIDAAADEAELLAKSEAVIFAIKPQIFDDVIPKLAGILRGAAACSAPGSGADASDSAIGSGGAGSSTADDSADGSGAAASDKVFISIAAGISIAWLANVLGDGAKIVRVMPNTPAMVGEGMSALARSSSVTDDEFESVKEVFSAVGRALEVTEAQMDAVTGISGSSPAYAYMYMQALIESGVRHGLDERQSRVFAAQATLGAAKMVLENEGISAEQLRLNVCSPGGTTIEAVGVLEKEGFMDTVKRAVYACVEKSKKMAK